MPAETGFRFCLPENFGLKKNCFCLACWPGFDLLGLKGVWLWCLSRCRDQFKRGWLCGLVFLRGKHWPGRSGLQMAGNGAWIDPGEIGGKVLLWLSGEVGVLGGWG